MEFRILGPLDVLEGGRPVRVSGARERALLAILLIHAGQVVSADRLIDELWGRELPAHPANALQVVVSRVRRALAPSAGASRLVTRRPGYVLHVESGELDAHRFVSLVEQARLAAPADQARLLGEALGLWRGPALAEFAAEGFATAELERGRRMSAQEAAANRSAADPNPYGSELAQINHDATVSRRPATAESAGCPGAWHRTWRCPVMISGCSTAALSCSTTSAAMAQQQAPSYGTSQRW